jgi:hypothetical protein
MTDNNTMTDKRMMRGFGAALALAAVVGTRAQAQSTGTAIAAAPTTERYRLVEVAGNALPAEVEKEWNCREQVTRGMLTLGADSTWSFRATIREVCGDRAEVDTEEESGRYSLEGGTIGFRDDDEDDRDGKLRRDVDLDDLETGTLAADGTLTARLEDGTTTLVFRK